METRAPNDTALHGERERGREREREREALCCKSLHTEAVKGTRTGRRLHAFNSCNEKGSKKVIPSPLSSVSPTPAIVGVVIVAVIPNREQRERNGGKAILIESSPLFLLPRGKGPLYSPSPAPLVRSLKSLLLAFHFFFLFTRLAFIVVSSPAPAFSFFTTTASLLTWRVGLDFS